MHVLARDGQGIAATPSALGEDMPRKTRGMIRLALTKTMEGITKRFPASRVFTLDGTKYTRDELAAVFKEHLVALDAVDAAHAVWRAAVASERKVGRATHKVASAFQYFVHGELGTSPVELGHFGWKTPKKPGPKTTAAKLTGIEKRAATRAARKTMGSRQRRKIKGAPAH